MFVRSQAATPPKYHTRRAEPKVVRRCNGACDHMDEPRIPAGPVILVEEVMVDAKTRKTSLL